MAELSLHPYSEEAYKEKIESPLNNKQKQVLKDVLAILDNIDKNKGLQSEFKAGLLDKITHNPEMLGKLLTAIEGKMLAELAEINKSYNEGKIDNKKAIEESKKAIHSHIHMQTIAFKNSLEKTAWI